MAVASRRRPLPGHPCPDSSSPIPTKTPLLPPRPPRLRVSLHQKTPNNPASPSFSSLATWRFNHLKNPSTPTPRLPLRPPRLRVSLHPKKSPPINHPARKIKPQMNADSRRFWKSSAHRDIHPVGQCSCSHKSFKINVYLCSSAVHFLSSTLNLSSASSSATSPPLRTPLPFDVQCWAFDVRRSPSPSTPAQRLLCASSATSAPLRFTLLFLPPPSKINLPSATPCAVPALYAGRLHSLTFQSDFQVAPHTGTAHPPRQIVSHPFHLIQEP